MKSNAGKSDEVFSKLPHYGYSEGAAEKVWRWYHPSGRVMKSSFK